MQYRKPDLRRHRAHSPMKPGNEDASTHPHHGADDDICGEVLACKHPLNRHARSHNAKDQPRPHRRSMSK